MDEATKKIIEHGKRIRLCFKQQELQPMSVPEQIVILLALTSGLFDTIPVAKMKEAEHAIQEMDAELPAELLKRLFSDKELSSSDRDTILKMAENILEPFQEKPETDQNNNNT